MTLFKFLLAVSTVFFMQTAMAKMCPDGSYVAGNKRKLCPDGSYVDGSRCKLMPNGTYIGVN